MPEYLSKEEIRKWRSSLERITLEEYAARLGKVIQDEKDTDDIVDKVMKRSLSSMSTENYVPRTEEIRSIYLKSSKKEKEVVPPKKSKPLPVAQKPVEKPKKAETKKVEPVQKEEKPIVNMSQDDMPLTFNKALTGREQMVFDHFYSNKNKIVYAKDLAKILDLPRDYVYKYIKNLRSKLNEDVLLNADNGGYMLKIQ